MLWRIRLRLLLGFGTVTLDPDGHCTGHWGARRLWRARTKELARFTRGWDGERDVRDGGATTTWHNRIRRRLLWAIP